MGSIPTGGIGIPYESMYQGRSAEVIALLDDEGAPSVTGLSCSSSRFCTAIGFYYPNSGGERSFAERWDGSGWSIEVTPAIAGAFQTQLSGVSCTSPSACIVVGQYNALSSRPSHSLAERWTGTRWSVEVTPAGQSDELVGVSCASARACMAVGNRDSNAGFEPLVERTDGTIWSVDRTPSAAGGLLQAVSCTSGMICTAVGNTSRGSVLAEQSVPASAELSGMPAACTSTRFTMHVTGAGISLVTWSVDSSRIKGRIVRPGTPYAASIRLSPGRHKLTVRVTFMASSQTPALTFRRNLRGCSPAHVPR